MEVRTYIFDVPTSVGDHSFTVPGWGETPAAAKFVLIATDATDGFDNGSAIGFGVADGTNQGALQVAYADNQASSDVARGTIDDGCIYATTPDQTELFEATFSQWETGGVELTWSGASIASNTHKVVATFFSGVDVEAHVSFYQQGAHVVDVGFVSKLIFAGTIGAGAVNDRAAFGIMTFGVCSNGTNGLTQNYYGQTFDNAQANSVGGHNLGTGFSASQVNSSNIQWEGAISSIDSSGFNIGSSGSDYILFLCLNFDDDVDSGFDTIPTSGDISITDPGFTPQIAGVIFSNRTAVNSHSATGTPVLGIGEVDSVSENSVEVSGEIGVSTMNHTSVHSSNLIHTEDADQSDIADGSFDAFTANGFDVTMATWPGSALYFIWWAIEAAEAEDAAATAESASISEAQTVQAELNSADAESASIDDTPAAQAELNASVSESASISEAQTGEEENEAAISESASINEAPTAQAELNDNTSEGADISEAQSGLIERSAAVTESASITEAQTGEIVSGAESATISESVSIDDAPTVQAELSDSVLESLSISETCDAQLISNPDVTESLAITAVQSVPADAQPIQAVPVDIILTDTIKDDIFVMDSIKAELILQN
jgi:hypothetical protein